MSPGKEESEQGVRVCETSSLDYHRGGPQGPYPFDARELCVGLLVDSNAVSHNPEATFIVNSTAGYDLERWRG